MKYNWALYNKAFDIDIIDNLVSFVEENYQLQTGKTVTTINNEHTNVKNNKRLCEVAWIGQNDNDSFIKPLLWDVAQQANSTAFGFDIRYIAEFQYTVYNNENNGYYTWHRDSMFTSCPTMYDRKLTIVVQLSDPSDYTGGDLIIENDFNGNLIDKENIRNKGSIIVFPSFIKHKVSRVMSGKRRSLVAWVLGPQFR